LKTLCFSLFSFPSQQRTRLVPCFYLAAVVNGTITGDPHTGLEAWTECRSMLGQLMNHIHPHGRSIGYGEVSNRQGVDQITNCQHIG